MRDSTGEVVVLRREGVSECTSSPVPSVLISQSVGVPLSEVGGFRPMSRRPTIVCPDLHVLHFCIIENK